MNVKTVCPPDCQNRSAGCGATCEKFLQHREECKKRYAAQAEQRKIDEIIGKSVKESYGKIRRKVPQY